MDPFELEYGNILEWSDEFFRDWSDMKWEMELRLDFDVIYGVGINH
jgi:hypothetical protein